MVLRGQQTHYPQEAPGDLGHRAHRVLSLTGAPSGRQPAFLGLCDALSSVCCAAVLLAEMVSFTCSFDFGVCLGCMFHESKVSVCPLFSSLPVIATWPHLRETPGWAGAGRRPLQVLKFTSHLGFLQRRQWHPTPVLLPGKSHGRRSLVGCSPWGCYESDTTERLHFHFSLSCIGEGNGTPLQYSCLENPRDRGAWWAAVYGVAQSRTRLKRLSSSSTRFLKLLNVETGWDGSLDETLVNFVNSKGKLLETLSKETLYTL